MPFDEELANRVRDLIQGEEGVSERKMFGGLAFLVNGNMAVAASGQGGLLVRADPKRSDELTNRPHVELAVMQGRTMDGWLRVSGDGVRTEAQLRRWVEVGVSYARALPSKR